MQWVYKKQTRWLIITKNQTESDQQTSWGQRVQFGRDVKEMDGFTNTVQCTSSTWQRNQRNGWIYKKSKKWMDLQTSYNVQVDRQTKITPIFCRLEWMISHKWHVHNLFPYFFYTQIHCSINKWKYSLNSLDAAWWNCSCLKYLTDALNTFDHLYLVNDTKTKPRQNVL